MMTCRFTQALMDFFPDATGALQRLLARHLERCPQCQQYARLHANVRSSMNVHAQRALRDGPVDLAPALHRRLMACHTAKTAANSPLSGGQVGWAWATGVCAVIMLVVVSALFWQHSLGPRPGVVHGPDAVAGVPVNLSPALWPAVAVASSDQAPLSLDQLARLPEAPLLQESQFLLADVQAAVSHFTRELDSVADLAQCR